MKPDNIFLDEHNNIKIGDFGLARALSPLVLNTPSYFGSIENAKNIELTGVAGTPLYLSPEQIKLGKCSD